MPFTAAKLGAVQGSVIVGIGGWQGAKSSRPWFSALHVGMRLAGRSVCPAPDRNLGLTLTDRPVEPSGLDRAEINDRSKCNHESSRARPILL